MLDELVKTAAAMERARIPIKDWHPKLKPLPKVTARNPCIRVWLDADGHITDLESLAAEHAAKLRKFEPDNGKSFPGFNVRPLFALNLPYAETKKVAKNISENLKRQPVDWSAILAGTSDLWAKDTINTVNRVLKHIRVDLEKACGELDANETLKRLFAAVNKMDASRFQAEYEKNLKSKIAEGSLALPAMLFLGEEGKEGKVSVFLDVKDYDDYPVAHERTIARLNELLLACCGKDAAPISCRQVKDAYGSEATGSENPKMAQVVVPVLGGVFLRSQAKEIPAQSRYALCEGATFPVGDQTRASVKRALEWLSNPERAGKTYGIVGDKELIFAYPAQLPPDSCPELAFFLGAKDDDERQFADVAESVIGQLKGMGTGAAQDGEVQIFSLRKMDKARTKVVYHRNTTVSSLEAASRSWDAGFKNIPPLDIREWGDGKTDKGKSFTVSVEPRTLFPVRLHKHLNVVWTLSRNDTTQSKVRLFEPATGLRLFLESPTDAQTAYIAERFLAHAETYFIALCRAKGRNEISGLPDLDTYPGILGLLLYKLGQRKDTYMNESAFQLGRFLRVADEIHRLYCEVVRKKDLPPELCGSAMLAATLENPTQALAQLGMRSAPYLKWARAYHDDEKGGLVHYWMQQWASIADALHKTSWPVRPSPAERAQVFLGYLSSFPKTANSSTTT